MLDLAVVRGMVRLAGAPVGVGYRPARSEPGVGPPLRQVKAGDPEVLVAKTCQPEHAEKAQQSNEFYETDYSVRQILEGLFHPNDSYAPQRSKSVSKIRWHYRLIYNV